MGATGATGVAPGSANTFPSSTLLLLSSEECSSNKEAVNAAALICLALIPIPSDILLLLCKIFVSSLPAPGATGVKCWSSRSMKLMGTKPDILSLSRIAFVHPSCCGG